MFSWLKNGVFTKNNLNGLKNIKVNGMRFTIKRVNPLLDLPSDKIPQFFTDYPAQLSNKDPLFYKRSLENMILYVNAGIVSPELVPIGKGDKKGKEDGITAEDLFRDPSMGTKLYLEIMDHSLNTFRGLKGLFFSIKRRLLSFITLRVSMGYVRQMLSSQQAISQ